MESILLLCAVVIVICIVASRLSQRLGVPALLLFLALGMLFGSDGLFRIPFDNFEAAERICSVALIFIMFYGGFGTRWEAARPAAARAVVLSTLGVAVTALLTALFCHLALGFSALESFLTGAVISSTDAASVFSILRSKKLGLRNHTASLLEVESGSNDPASYMLTVIALSLMGVGGGGAIPWMIFAQVVFGLGLGAAVAGLSILVLRRLTLSDGLDTIFVVAAALLSVAVQGSLLPLAARKLDMVDSAESISRTFNDYQDQRQLHLTRFPIGAGHPWVGRTIGECELPADALVVMLRRGSENVIPNGDTAIQAGDLMVLSTPLYEDDDGVSLREVPVAEHGDWIGRPIKELGIPAEVLIVLVRRADGTTVVPKGGTVLQQGDMLVVNEWEET